jgi:putative colanic acid biosynthesis glycosyltransferase
MPRLSIITVCKDALPALRKTAESLFKLRGFADIQWIVVDGASKDGTAAWLQGLRLPNLTWISERDSGLYNAMNKGIVMAKGEWLWFVNAGDTMQPAILEAVDWEHSSTVVFIGCRDEGKPVKIRRFGMPYCHQGMLFRNGTGIRYDEHFKISSDYDYLLKHLRKSNLTVKQVPMFFNQQYIDADVSGVNRKHRDIRDHESFHIAWNHLGMGMHIFFYAGLLSYRLFDKIRSNKLHATQAAS